MKKTELVANDKGFEYYCKGLIAKEIAILLGCSYRTVQNYMCSENWKDRRLERRNSEKQKLKEQIINAHKKDEKPRFLGSDAFHHIKD